MQGNLKTQDNSTHSPRYHTRTREQRQGGNTLLHGRQYKSRVIPRRRQATFKKQGTHSQGKYKSMEEKLTTQGKRGQKVTKWSVQILESGVGRAGFVEFPVTLWKEVPQEVR